MKEIIIVLIILVVLVGIPSEYLRWKSFQRVTHSDISFQDYLIMGDKIRIYSTNN